MGSWRLLLILLATMALPARADFAAEGIPVKIRFGLGGMWTANSTSGAVGAEQGGVGVYVNLEDVFNLPGERNVFGGVAEWRLKGKHSIDFGFTDSVSIPLPLFDRQQAGENRAAAEALQARAESGLARTRAEGELRGLHRQVERLTAAAADYRNRGVATSAELLRIAEAAYQGGESTLLELLDAYRGALDAEITALDLEWKARDARIEYDLLTGSVFE